jgi:hypothetical protein
MSVAIGHTVQLPEAHDATMLFRLNSPQTNFELCQSRAQVQHQDAQVAHKATRQKYEDLVLPQRTTSIHEMHAKKRRARNLGYLSLRYHV